jgi:hypothetical protein
VAGDVLDHRGDAAGQQPLHRRTSEVGDHGRVASEGAIADDRVRLRVAEVDAGRAVGVEAHAHQFVRQQVVVQAHGFAGGLGITRIEVAELLGRTAAHGERRLQPLHPTAFLVDEDQRALVFHGLAELVVRARSDQRTPRSARTG